MAQQRHTREKREAHRQVARIWIFGARGAGVVVGANLPRHSRHLGGALAHKHRRREKHGARCVAGGVAVNEIATFVCLERNCQLQLAHCLHTIARLSGSTTACACRFCTTLHHPHTHVTPLLLCRRQHSHTQRCTLSTAPSHTRLVRKPRRRWLCTASSSRRGGSLSHRFAPSVDLSVVAHVKELLRRGLHLRGRVGAVLGARL